MNIKLVMYYGTVAIIVSYLIYTITVVHLYRVRQRKLKKAVKSWYMDVRPVYFEHVMNATTEGMLRDAMLDYLLDDGKAMVFWLANPSVKTFNEHFCAQVNVTSARLINECDNQILNITQKFYDKYKS